MFQILLTEALTDNDNSCGTCQETGNVIYRCSDCFYTGLFCHDCCLKDHARHPFHWISQWNGQYFKPITLRDIGYVVYLGHGGIPCPATGDHVTTDVVFVDVGCIYIHKVAWCRCSNAHSKAVQLLRMRQYPASLTSPRTAFTFRVLDDFYMDSVQCNTTAEAFCRKKQRLTNVYHPNGIPVSTILLTINH